MNNPSSSTLGRLLKDTYRIDDYLGEGGPSVVYKGTDILLDVPVAIKRLKAGLPLRSGHTTAQRFLREARTQARLHHQHIVGIRAMHEEGEDTFIVMEFVQGVDLHEYIGCFPQFQLPLNEALFIFEHALEGLGFAHKHGVIHRDIKPSNILLGEGLVVKLADFGIARALDDQKLTQTGSLLGTLLYISPEQLRGEIPDPRADIYSMGISLYEALVGHTPFARHSDEIHNGYELLSRHLFTPPDPPSAFRPDIPEALNQVILQSIAKKPDDRFPDCHHFAQALRSALLPHITPLKQWSHPLQRTVVSPPPASIPVKPPLYPDPLASSAPSRGTQSSAPSRGTQTAHPSAPLPSPHLPPDVATPPPAQTASSPHLTPSHALNTLDPFSFALSNAPSAQRRTQTAPTLSPLTTSPPLSISPAPPTDDADIASAFPSGDDFHSPPLQNPAPSSDPEMQTLLDDQLSADQIRQHHALYAASMNPDASTSSRNSETSNARPRSLSNRFDHASALSTSEMQDIALSLSETIPSLADQARTIDSNVHARSNRRFFGRLLPLFFLLLGGATFAWWYTQTSPTTGPSPHPPLLSSPPHNPTTPSDTTPSQPAITPQTTPLPNTPSQAPTPPSSHTVPPHRTGPQTPAVPPKSNVIRGMLWVPSGWFWQGKEQRVAIYRKRPNNGTLHHPLRKVYISGFWIDAAEVTVGAYRACVDANQCPDIEVAFSSTGKKLATKRSIAQSFPPAEPMRFVDWKEAFTFCRWQQKRLPTEAEWEYAARGSVEQADPKQRFSWRGTALTCQHAVHKGCAKQPLPNPNAAQRSLGKSPFGAVDLLGNVWEWVQDCYSPDAARYTPPTNPVYDLPDCKRRILRGGSFLSNKRQHELTVYHRRHSSPTARRDENGFRCAFRPTGHQP